MTNTDPSQLLETTIMGVTDWANYIVFKNPVSATIIDTSKAIARPFSGGSSPPNPPTSQIPSKILEGMEHLVKNQDKIVWTSSPYIRFAGMSGAIAVLCGAYGAHALARVEDSKERRRVYKTASLYHYVHTLALMGIPLSRHPKMTFSFMALGMTIFCGSCYYDAFTGDRRFRRYTPIGGCLLIVGWLGFVI